MESEHYALYEYCENVMIYGKIQKFITERGLISPDMTVIAAVSGGADSVCLLEVLKKLSSVLSFSLECAHFNHNLRGAESDGDEEFVRRLCEGLVVPLSVGGADVRALSVGESLEDAARKARYGFFKTLTDGRNAVVATAHTQNDNVETFFINLLRGSGGRGLCAVPASRPGVIRPMLEITRDEIVAHLDSVGLTYRTDSTNADTAYLRNFIRLDILPRLASRPEIDPYAAVSRAVSNLCLENDALNGAAKTNETDDVSRLLTLPDAVLWRVLTNRLENEFGIILDSVHFRAVKALLLRGNSKEQIKADVFAVTENGRLSFKRIAAAEKCAVKLCEGENIVDGKRILIKNVKEVYNHLTKDCIDCDRIDTALYADRRRDGDIFYPQRKNASTHLTKLLKSDRVPLLLRNSLMVIRDAGGNAVYVEGYGADRRFAANKNSEKTVCIEII